MPSGGAGGAAPAAGGAAAGGAAAPAEEEKPAEKEKEEVRIVHAESIDKARWLTLRFLYRNRKTKIWALVSSIKPGLLQGLLSIQDIHNTLVMRKFSRTLWI